MNWTKEKPTKEGYYWLNEHFQDQEIQIVYVENDEVFRCGSDVGENLSGKGFYNFEAPDAEWYGPLEPPEIDYRELLKRYMRAMEIKNGTTFVRGDPHPRGETLEELGLTKEDIAELEKIQLLLDYKVH